MDFGVVLQTCPPAWSVVEMARQAELAGFGYAWTFDSHMLWEEPFVIYSQMLSATHALKVGPMVTNPLTRDWTVTASLFATLNDMFGNRTICGIGRGDSAVRVTNGQPATVATLRQAMTVIRGLANGQEIEYRGATLRLAWARDSRLSIWVAGYGPKVLELAGQVGDGFILQVADPAIVAWSVGAVRAAATDAGRDPTDIKVCVAAPAYLGDDMPHQRDQCRWFGGMVGNHVAEIVARYGGNARVPRELTDYIAGRQDYDYNEHGRSGSRASAFVPDEVLDRFCLLGDEQAHIDRLKEMESIGVDQFALYLQHDAKLATLQAYGERVLPAFNDQARTFR